MAINFIRGFFPNYKLHKVCANNELRPAMCYVYFKDGNAYATDAHIAIAAPLSFVSDFTDEEKKILEGKLIHATNFALLLKMRKTYVKETEDGAKFECETKAGETVIIPIFTEEQIGKFPNVESIMAEADKNAKELDTQFPCVGFNPSHVANLVAAMNAKIIEFYFVKPVGVIIVRDIDETNEIRAIMMPYYRINQLKTERK